MNETIITICISLLVLMVLAIIAVGSMVVRYFMGEAYDIKKLLFDRYVQFTPSVEKLISLANDIWRLKRNLAKIESTLSPEDKKRLESSMRRLEAYLRESDIEITDLVGRPYNEGLSVEAINFEYNEAQKQPVIKETVIPMITYKGIIKQQSQVVVLSNEKGENKDDAK